MNLCRYYVLVVLLVHSIQCVPTSWLDVVKILMNASSEPQGQLQESVPFARSVHTFETSSLVFQDAIFHAKLSRSANCRSSLDKWDCDDCKDILPDGVVVRAFSTYPYSVTGNVVRSTKNRTIYVIIRTDSNVRAKVLGTLNHLVDHPTIPDAKVQQGFLVSMAEIRDIVYKAVNDQLLLHPTFKVHVVGHSLGAGIGSLLVADLHHRLPNRNRTNLVGYLMGKPRVGNAAYAKHFIDNKISVKRFVQMTDSIVHQPPLEYGFVHEGSEYWLKNNEEFVYCPEPFETKNCSSSLNFTEYSNHSTYFGVPQSCDNLLNVL